MFHILYFFFLFFYEFECGLWGVIIVEMSTTPERLDEIVRVFSSLTKNPGFESSLLNAAMLKLLRKRFTAHYDSI